MKFISAAFALLLGVTSCQQKQENPEAVIEQKVDALLSQMTLEEKLGQMNQISSYGNIDDMIALIKKGEIGFYPERSRPCPYQRTATCGCTGIPPRHPTVDSTRCDSRLQDHLPHSTGTGRFLRPASSRRRSTCGSYRSLLCRHPMDLCPHD